MEIAIALAAPSLNPPSGVRFEVLVQPSNGTTATVFQATIDSSQSQRGTDWLYFEIPLDAFEGQVVRIALTTSTTEATTASTLAALWAAPRIMSAE